MLRRGPNALAAAADRRPDVAAVAAVARGARGADAAAEQTRSAPADDERTLAAAEPEPSPPPPLSDERSPSAASFAAASLAAASLAAASERERDDAPGRHVRGASRLVAAPRRYTLGAIERRRRDASRAFGEPDLRETARRANAANEQETGERRV